MTVTYPDYFWVDQYTHQIHEAGKFSKFVLPDTLKTKCIPWPSILGFLCKTFYKVLKLTLQKTRFRG